MQSDAARTQVRNGDGNRSGADMGGGSSTDIQNGGPIGTSGTSGSSSGDGGSGGVGAAGGDTNSTGSAGAGGNTGSTSNPTSTRYSIGGSVSGLGLGQAIAVHNGAESLLLSANGAFQFGSTVALGGGYHVVLVEPVSAWRVCTLSAGDGSAVSANVDSVRVVCVNMDMAATGRLNDTGIDFCFQNFLAGVWQDDVACSSVNWSGNLWGLQQDAFVGRDAQARALGLQKVGAGVAGFDFTRIASTGKVLPVQNGVWSDTGSELAGTQWDCVRDNLTGLVWEVKRNDATHLRHMAHTYAWYNPDANRNGGAPGYEVSDLDNNHTELGPTCTGVADVNKCNTQSYVAAVNAAGLCGQKDWRMPTFDELFSLTNVGRSDPSIDIAYFPNTPTDFMLTWTASPNAQTNAQAWGIFFKNGYGLTDAKSAANWVRLVRSAQ